MTVIIINIIRIVTNVMLIIINRTEGLHMLSGVRELPRSLGWRYLSNVTWLMRLRLFYVLLVGSRIIIVRHSIRHV